MLQALVIPLAKIGIDNILGGTYGKITNVILFEFLLGKEKDERLDVALGKIDSVLKGQAQIVDMIAALPPKIGLKFSLDKAHNIVHGLLLAVKSRSTSGHDISAMQKFLALSGEKSCRGLADDLTQKLFGTGNVTPDGFWVNGLSLEANGSVQSDSYVASHIYSFIRATPNGSLSLEDYMEKMGQLYHEVTSWYLYLAATFGVVHAYLKEIGRLEVELNPDNSPALSKFSALAELMTTLTMSYLIKSSGMAYYIYYQLFIAKQSTKAAIITTARSRILECDDSKGRSPVKLRTGKYAGFHGPDYGSNKVVYAEYDVSMLDSANANLWWNFECVHADSSKFMCTIRSERGSKYLGVYKITIARINSGKFGVGYNYNDEITVGASETDTRAWWKIYVRRDKLEEGNTFNFVNQYNGAALCVSDAPQASERQVFAWGVPDNNPHKIFEIKLPQG